MEFYRHLSIRNGLPAAEAAHRCAKRALLLREPLLCSPAAETDLRTLIWGSENSCSHALSLELFIFADR